MIKVPARILKALAKAGIPEELPDGRRFLIVGPHVWGRGDSFREAFHNARIEGAAVEKKFVLFDAPAKARVDEMGMIVWTWEEGEAAPEETKELLRFGIEEKKK